ncbi:MAG: hypothetical protein IKB68_04750 [Rikenellaceae bacterium]|nr:hypothetical protein [Rikenellaceae bacterium]MBP3612742.1 hypothetical protein [Rikenellaceae bacterium]MBP3682471.1 hypothetical protein [Rikenellaceae bacterium]MBQ3255184.1 hypothetical protein [Rikenellaceae bacterium]MBQ6691267.1 hypothetical protein [Rikenellaceae bacterium]
MPIDTRPIERLLSGLCPPLRARRIAQRLLSASLLDTTRLRDLTILLYVDEQTTRGRAKTEALEQAAIDFGCSYSTACRAVYDTTNQQIIKLLRK